MLSGDHRLGNRQIAQRGTVQMDEIELRLAGQRNQLRAQRRQVSRIARLPVESGRERLRPQPCDRFGLGASGRRGLWPGHREHDLEAQLDEVLPNNSSAIVAVLADVYQDKVDAVLANADKKVSRSMMVTPRSMSLCTWVRSRARA